MMARAGSKRVLYVLTAAQSVRAFYSGQLEWMAAHGFSVHVASAPGEGLRSVASDAVHVHEIAGLERTPSFGRDVVAFLRVLSIVLRVRPDVVNAGTPKAGVMAMLAAKLVGVPNRIYTLHGLRFETATGPLRRALLAVEALSCRLSTRVLCVSHSVEAEATSRRLIPRGRGVTLRQGSVNGIDVDRFLVTDRAQAIACALRRSLRLPEGAPIIGFVGRLATDKGIPELVVAFDLLREQYPHARLLLIGEFDPEDPLPVAIRTRMLSCPNIVLTGYVADPVPFYHLVDCVVLPTRREGFPLAALEAAAAAKPMVVTDATGARDAALQGVAGVVVEVGDAIGLFDALVRLVEDGELRRSLGEAARAQVIERFPQEPLWREISALYNQ